MARRILLTSRWQRQVVVSMETDVEAKILGPVFTHEEVLMVKSFDLHLLISCFLSICDLCSVVVRAPPHPSQQQTTAML